jgi:hypothetical protein
MNSEYINNMNLYEHHHVHQQKQQQQQLHHNQHMHQQQQDQQIYHMQQQIQPQNNLIQMQHVSTTPINTNIIQSNSPHHLQQIHHNHHLQQQQQQHSSPQNMNQYQQMNQYHQQQQYTNQPHSTPASPHHLHNQQKQSLPSSPYSPHATSIQTPLQKQLSVISPSHHYQLSPSATNPTTTTNNSINYYQQQQQQQIINNQNQNKMINPLLKGPDENKNTIHINNNDDINKLQKINTNPQLPILSKQLPPPQLILPSHNYQIIQPQQQQQQIQSNLIQQAQIQKVKLSPGFQNQPQPMQQQQQIQKVALPNSVSYYPTTPTQTNSSYQIINQQPTTPLPQQHQTLNSNQMIKSPLINNQVQQQQQFLKSNNNNLMLNSPSIINNNNNNTSNQLNYYTNQTTRPNNNELLPQNNHNNNRINNNFGNNFIDKQLLVNNKPITTTQPAVIMPRTSSSNENTKPLIIDNKSVNNNKIISENSLLSINSISQISNLIESSLNEEEEQILAEYDCRLYGLLKLEMAENSLKKFFIIKAIVNYEKRINQMTDENFSNYATKEDKLSLDNDKHKCKYVQLAKLYLSLGHFYLLIYDYSKALECYQRFYRFKINKLQVNFTSLNNCKIFLIIFYIFLRTVLFIME